MNALEVVDEVRRRGATLAVEDGQLVVRGTRERLPNSLREELAQHKAELLVALGCPLDKTIAGILAELRPNLSAALRRLPDDRLLILVNWHIIAAWEKTIQEMGRPKPEDLAGGDAKLRNRVQARRLRGLRNRERS